MTKDDVAVLFETILSVPGMNESVKVDLKMTRTGALLLSTILDRGLNVKNPDDKSFNLLESVSADQVAELKSFAEECLKKAGMTEFSEKLKRMNGK